MKKFNLFKTVLSVAAAMLLNVVVFGQNPPAPYGVYDANLTAPTNIDYVTLKGAGTTMGYYALPDPVYHPNYVASGTLTAGFAWGWNVVADPGTAPTITPGLVGPPDMRNYATILFPVLGHYSLSVAETAPAAMGGCVDGTPTELEVEVIAAPTGTMSIAPAGWQAITANQAYQICAAQAAQTVTVSFVENVPDALASYAFEITETIEQLNGIGTVIATPQAEVVVEDFDFTHKVKATELDGADATGLTSAAFNAATPNFSFTFASDALNLTQNAGLDVRTRYTYKVKRTGSAVAGTDFDFLSNISHKSDYLAGAGSEVYYAFANNTVSFIVNPAPATGPIYYVPNNFRY